MTTRHFDWRYLVAGLALLLLAGGGYFALRPGPPPAFDYITEKAKALDFAIDRIAGYVRDQVKAENYDGALRGPLGTLWAEAGNDLDRALLLLALLDRAGVKARLVRGERWGVEIDQGGTRRYLGPALSSDPAAAVQSVPGNRYHMLAVALHSVVAGVARVEPVGEFRAADLVGHDLRIAYRSDKQQRFAVVEAPGKVFVSSVDAAAATSQEIVFRLAGPGVLAAEIRRELFTAAFKDFPSFFHPDNRYAVIVSAGWIPDHVRSREAERARGWTDASDALNHVIAYTFLARSDAHARAVMAEKSVAAAIVSPRITIAAIEHEIVDGAKRRVASLDLRKNDIRVETDGERAIAFRLHRSLVDAALESSVLTALTGQQAFSALDVLADAIVRREATLAQRQRALRMALERLLGEMNPEASLRVAPAGKRDFWIRFDRKAGDTLGAVASEAVRRALDAAGARDFELLRDPVIRRAAVEPTAREVEAMLAIAAKLSSRYELDIDYVEAPTSKWYRRGRIFYYRGPKGELTFERQTLAVEPDLRLAFIDYYDEKNGRMREPPGVGTLTTTRQDLEHARAYTTWYNRRSGQTVGMISRDARRELVKDGSTVLRYRFGNGSETEPIRFWLLRRFERDVVINNRPIRQPMLRVAGDYEKNRRERPKNPAEVPAIVDPGAGGAINRFTILDDPEFPLFMGGEKVQTALPGRVVDAASGRGVAEAKITVHGPNVSAQTWPDGQFVLPIISQPFNEFEISAAATGYKPLRVKRDFRLATAFPIELKLEPPANENGFLWIDRANLATALPGAALSERAKAVIGAAIRANKALAVAVPKFPLYYTYGRIEAWFELDTETGEAYPRLVDGLYGSSLRDKLISGAAPEPYALQRGAISYFAGRIAAWYLFAAGALESVAANIEKPEMTLLDMYKLAVARLREMAKMYDGFWLGVAIGIGARPPLIGGKVMSEAFRKGLRDGLDWSEEFYRKAWGL